jgi:hypothetical protein
MNVSPNNTKWLRIENSIPYLTVGELTVGKLNGGSTGGSTDRAVGSCNDSLQLVPIVQGVDAQFVGGSIYLTAGKTYYIKAAVENVVFANHIGSAVIGWTNVSLPTTTIVGSGQYHPIYGFQSMSFVYTPPTSTPLNLTVVGNGLLSINKILVEITVL